MKTILLIDDADEIRLLLRAILERAGYHVEEAADGVEAAKCFKRSKPQLVITDLFMPERDGIETIQAFRKADPDLPIIAMTGVARDCFLQAAKHLGAKVTLKKPFQNHQVISAVQSLLAA
jgi:CheY-like chemotaxis protein